MVKAQREEKFPTEERQHLPVVNIHHVCTPDANLRLTHAIDILLRSTPREPEENINTEIEEKPLQDSRSEKVAKENEEI